MTGVIIVYLISGALCVGVLIVLLFIIAAFFVCFKEDYRDWKNKKWLMKQKMPSRKNPFR